MTDTLVVDDGSQTLTNKTIDADNNTVSNIGSDEVKADLVTGLDDASAFESGDKLIISETGVGLRKIDYDDLPSGGGGGSLDNVVDDTTPQLGGNLDCNGNYIVTADAATPESLDIYPGEATSGDNQGGNASIFGGAGSGSGRGGELEFVSGDGGATGQGGTISFTGGSGGATSGDGGGLTFLGGDAQNGNSDGGSVDIMPGQGDGSGSSGSIRLYADSTIDLPGAILDLSNITTSDKTFTFPNTTGTLALTSDISGTPGGADTQVQFNDGGSFGGSSKLTWDDANARLIVGEENEGGGIFGVDATTTNADGGSLFLYSGAGDGTGVDGDVFVANATETGGISIAGDASVEIVSDGLSIAGGTGDMNFSTDAGTFKFSDGGAIGALDFSSITTSDKTFTFPNTTGTLALTSDIPDVVDDTTPQLGGDLDCNGNNLTDVHELRLDASPDSDHSANGPTTDTINAGETITAIECVYLHSDGEWHLADADATATADKLLAIALEAGTDGNSLEVALPGSFVRDDTWAWTVGGAIYLSTTAGDLTQTAPSGEDDVVRVVGYATHADRMYFNTETGVTHT